MKKNQGVLDILKNRVSVAGMFNQSASKLNAKLLNSALSGDYEIVNFLVMRGANLEATDKFGFTPMHRAAWGGCVHTIGALVKNGASVNTFDRYGTTPLHLAVAMEGGSADAVRLLVEYGAAIDAEDCKGLTPLKRAEFDKDECAHLKVAQAISEGISLRHSKRIKRVHLLKSRGS